MDKGICLEFAKLSARAQPAYSHPYHKFKIPKPSTPLKGVYITINKLARAHVKYNNSYVLEEGQGKYQPNFKVHVGNRPLTCITSNVFLDAEWLIFTPKTKNRRFRNNSVS